MTKIVLTQKEAVHVAYYIAEKLGNGGEKNGCKAEFSSEWSGKWHDTSFECDSPMFHVGASRTKHSDGRIRNAYSYSYELLEFALWAIEHFPTIHSNVAEWRGRLAERASVIKTADADIRPFLRKMEWSDAAELRVALAASWDARRAVIARVQAQAELQAA